MLKIIIWIQYALGNIFFIEIMFEESSDDVWHQEDRDFQLESQHLRLLNNQGDTALNILSSGQHSLEPDMISGWKPKLPSCPLPLSYPNPYVDELLKHLLSSQDFPVVYVGPRYHNSVQVNQKYNYHWRYRGRYSVNLGVVKEAVRNVGRQNREKVKLEKKNFEFESAFESGNLDLTVQVKKNEFDCFLRSDTNTKGHTNWYYFKVKNQEKGQIRINICNMTKTRNLYSQGMKPFVKVGEGQWTQDPCYDVVFVERYCRYGFDRKTYQLQFSFHFTQPQQQVYFAYGIPYTYTDLQNFIKEIDDGKTITVQKLCESLGGIDVPLLIITNPTSATQISQFKKYKKKLVIISARIHPGQAHSSHVLEGFVRSLLCDSQQAEIMRNLFIFYVIPMINPDGVIAGNFRTSYIGKDLNRRFHELNKYLYPQITALCELCENLRKSHFKNIEFYFDFHGHSAKKNLFCYGPEHHPSKLYYFKARALAKMLEENNSIFSYKKSIFTISQQKKTTGRAFMLQKMRIPMAFTFQISNGIYENEGKINIFLDRQLLLQAGKVILEGMFKYVKIQMKIPRRMLQPKSHRKSMAPLRSVQAIRNVQMVKKRVSREFSELKKKKKKKTKIDIFDEKENKNNEFLELVQEIKNEEEHVEIEGNSDSEDSEEDFTKEQAKSLFMYIMKRGNCSDLLKKKTEKVKNHKFYIRKTKQENRDTGKGDEMEEKKYRSSKLIDMNKYQNYSNQRGGSKKPNICLQNEKVAVIQKNFTLLI